MNVIEAPLFGAIVNLNYVPPPNDGVDDIIAEGGSAAQPEQAAEGHQGPLQQEIVDDILNAQGNVVPEIAVNLVMEVAGLPPAIAPQDDIADVDDPANQVNSPPPAGNPEGELYTLDQIDAMINAEYGGDENVEMGGEGNIGEGDGDSSSDDSDGDSDTDVEIPLVRRRNIFKIRREATEVCVENRQRQLTADDWAASSSFTVLFSLT